MVAVIQILGQHPSFPSLLTDTTGIGRNSFSLDRAIPSVGIFQTYPPHDGYDGYDGFFKSCPRAHIFKSHFYPHVGNHFRARRIENLKRKHPRFGASAWYAKCPEEEINKKFLAFVP